MSHFLTFVLVSHEDADVVRRVRELMGPYFTPEGAWLGCGKQGADGWAAEVKGAVAALRGPDGRGRGLPLLGLDSQAAARSSWRTAKLVRSSSSERASGASRQAQK
jgi:hypothetical protein